MPSWVSVLIVLGAVVLLGLLVGLMAGLSLRELYQKLPEYEAPLSDRGWVLGPIGAVLSEPLTLTVQRLILSRFPDTQALAHLISDDG